MLLKINYCQDFILDGIPRLFLAWIVFLCLSEAEICSGAMIDELNINSTFYQKLSSGKVIKYYKNVENGTPSCHRKCNSTFSRKSKIAYYIFSWYKRLKIPIYKALVDVSFLCVHF